MTKHNMPHAERFWMKVEKRADGCWLWTGATNARGYGQIRLAGKSVRAHRWSWEHVHGPVPAGLVIDHVCKVTLCVNPDHLESVTQQENVRRGDAWRHSERWRAASRAMAKARTSCIHGHPFDAVNTTRDHRGYRRCRECSRKESRERAARRRAA